VTKTIRPLGLAVLLAGCCLHRIDLDTFRQAPLPSQIKQYETAMAKGCIRLEQPLLLDAIAAHRLDAVEAMVELLKHPNQNFPLPDAIDVIELIHFGGTDLRGNEVMVLLDQIAHQSTDPEVRDSAKRAAEEIRANRVARHNW
jgi:hypothetical protein